MAGTLRLGLFGGAIALTVLFFPGGIMQLLDRLGRALRGMGPEGRAGVPVEAEERHGLAVESGSGPE